MREPATGAALATKSEKSSAAWYAISPPAEMPVRWMAYRHSLAHKCTRTVLAQHDRRWAAPPGRGRASRSAAGRGRRPRSGRPCTTQSCSPRSSRSPRSCRSTCTYMVLAGRARHVRVPDLPVTTCSAPVVPAVTIVPRREAGRTLRTGLRVEPIAVDVPRTRVARVRVARSVWLCHHNVELPLVDEEGEPVFPPFSPGCVVEAVEVEHEHLRRPPRVGWRQRQPVVAGRPPARLRGVADPEVQPLGAGDAGGNRRRPAAARRGEDRLACEEDEGRAHRRRGGSSHLSGS